VTHTYIDNIKYLLFVPNSLNLHQLVGKLT